MSKWVAVVALVVLGAVGSTASVFGASPTLPPAVVSGTITSVGTDVVVVKTADGPKRVRLTAATRVGNWVPATLSDVKAGEMIGVTARKEMNGALTAEEIHIFPVGRPIQARQFPWTNGTIMTNAPVTSVVNAVSGRTVTLTYQGKPVRINIPMNTAIRRVTAGTRDELKVGTRISAFGAENKDGSFTAAGLTVYQGP